MTMTMNTDRMVSDYLHDLERELADLPPERRNELLADMREHIAVSRAELAADDENGLRAILHRLGSPAHIAEQARADAGLPAIGGSTHAAPAGQRGPIEIIAVLLLLFSFLIPVVAGLAGAVTVALSKVWTSGEKLFALAIALVIGVTGSALYVGGSRVEFLIFAVVFAPPVGGIFLAVRLRGR